MLAINRDLRRFRYNRSPDSLPGGKGWERELRPGAEIAEDPNSNCGKEKSESTVSTILSVCFPEINPPQTGVWSPGEFRNGGHFPGNPRNHPCQQVNPVQALATRWSLTAPGTGLGWAMCPDLDRQAHPGHSLALKECHPALTH